MKLASAVGFVVGIAFIASPAHAAAGGKAILTATATHGGLVVHVGCGDGKLTAVLCGGNSFLVREIEGLNHNQKQMIATYKAVWFDYHVESLRRAAAEAGQ